MKMMKEKLACLLAPLFETGLLNGVPDEAYLKFEYRVLTGKKLRLYPPVTFNEKIQWLKLYDHNPLYRLLADKYKARGFVADVLGEEYLVPLFGVWENAGDINFGSLPESFVLKCTHGYGSTLLCREKSAFDIVAARKTLAQNAVKDFYGRGREWAYKDAKPRIIAEKLIDDGGGARPADYKFMCFNGCVGFVCVSRNLGDRGKGCVSFFSPDGTRASFKRLDYPEYLGEDIMPCNFEKMKTDAERLARAVCAPFIRVDFYETGGTAYFSEFTFYPCGGTIYFDPPEYDELMGEMLKITPKME